MLYDAAANREITNVLDKSAGRALKCRIDVKTSKEDPPHATPLPLYNEHRSVHLWIPLPSANSQKTSLPSLQSHLNNKQNRPAHTPESRGNTTNGQSPDPTFPCFAEPQTPSKHHKSSTHYKSAHISSTHCKSAGHPLLLNSNSACVILPVSIRGTKSIPTDMKLQ
jgi:hypothetical protein